MRSWTVTLLAGLSATVVGVVTCVGQGQSAQPVLHAVGPVTSGMGIQARHPTDADLDGMKTAGFAWVRSDVTWSRIEKTRGIYDWQEIDHRVAAMSARRLRPILILAYSNPLYTSKAISSRGQWPAPNDPQAISAFATWAATAASRYAHLTPTWELWNEPDGDVFWPPKADPTAYLSLAQRTCVAIRKVDSGATIWGPALSSQHDVSALDSPFLKTVLASSLPSCLSAISLHPYTSWRKIDLTPEFWHDVRALPTRSALPFVSSESGISKIDGTRLTDANQASYLVRMFIYNHMAHVPVSIWYDWRDDGPDPTSFEHNYGLMDFNGKPKPAFMALTTMVSQTAGLDRQCLVRESGRAMLYDWRQDRPDQLVLVAWSAPQVLRALTANPTGEIEVVLPGVKGSPTATDLYGHHAGITQTGTQIWRIDGEVQPYYIHYTGHIPDKCT
jgi:hypothetical protein